MSTYQALHGTSSIWDAQLYAPAAGATKSSSSSSSSSAVKYSHPVALRFASHPHYSGDIKNAKLTKRIDPATLPKKRRSGGEPPVANRAPRGKYCHYPHAVEQGLIPDKTGVFGWRTDSSAPKSMRIQEEPDSPRGKFARCGGNLPKEAWQAYRAREKNPRGRAARFSSELDPFPGRYAAGPTRVPATET
mmetsp:Transcript_18970/g.47419  ORF Transcript_18970/g.47419 Transcript_18970/m.47419 type:complete len:190 (+) Transcript_18970:85-654(+)|eukprot:g13907.t1